VRSNEWNFAVGVTNGTSYPTHSASQRALADAHAFPYRVEELILRDDTIAVAQQIEQELELLRLRGDSNAVVTQLTPLLVDLAILKDKHVPPLRA
jgi:hypothetical protein